MTRSRVLITGLALLVTAGVLRAQVTKETETLKGAAQVVTEQMTGEVVWVQGNTLVAKMLPRGYYSVFNVKPGREFIIDGQTRHIGDLRPGTVLIATVTTTTQPVTVRTTSSLTGRVWWVQGNYVVLTLANGENKEYNVPDSFRFVVEGKPASVSELKQGMNVSATKIVEEPHTEMSEKTVITGKSPK
ncbi:MAG: hypothetical protein ND807_01135 [Vicinamibacterales bacterium]|nr:hypothetical protein [Vicinamibacterales bacterium]